MIGGGYKDKGIEIEDRIDELINKMSKEQLVGQMVQLDGQKDLEKNYKRMECGSFLKIKGEDIQFAIDLARKTELQIPILFGIDSIHGYGFWPGATIFPTQLGVSCAWNRELIEEMGSITALEMRFTGVSFTFSPTCGIARELRWGRVNETFGEDPYLLSQLLPPFVRGYQGDVLGTDTTKILACAKHLVGYSQTEGGRDASESDLSERMLRSYFFPPFESALKAGVGCVMCSYQAIDGVPATANDWLLKEVLKEEWGFEGFVITDWNNVERLITDHHVCANMTEAAALAINSGCDMVMATPGFYDSAIHAVNEGLLSINTIKEAVRRVLRVKLKLGLFEDDRYPNVPVTKDIIGCAKHRTAALESARQSLVLLKNAQGILPLKGNALKELALIGPNADDYLAQLGDWVLGQASGPTGKGLQPRDWTITVKDGITSRFSGKLLYSRGCSITSDPAGDLVAIPDAIHKLKAAGLGVVVIGDTFSYYGEKKPTGSLDLMGGQLQLLNEIINTHLPFILVLINSKPLVIPEDVIENASAIIEQFNPGNMGGLALAQVLFGDYNPSGKLTISFPRCVGQQPLYYYKISTEHGTYADITEKPTFAFGEGIGYSNFTYKEIVLHSNSLALNDSLSVTLILYNEGPMAGEHIIQLYIKDLVTSCTWPPMLLKAFQKVYIEAFAYKTITLHVPVQQMFIVNQSGKRVVEPGKFEACVGPDSIYEHLTILPYEVIDFELI